MKGNILTDILHIFLLYAGLLGIDITLLLRIAIKSLSNTFCDM